MHTYIHLYIHVMPHTLHQLTVRISGQPSSGAGTICVFTWIYGSMHALAHISAHLAPVDNEEIRAAFVGRRDDVRPDALDLVVHDPVLAQGLGFRVQGFGLNVGRVSCFFCGGVGAGGRGATW